MKLVRDFLALCLACIGCIALTLGVPGAWLKANVVDEAGFMKIAAPLSADSALQQELATEALSQVAPDLPVPKLVRTKIEEFLTSQVHVVTDSEAYAQMWGASMKDLHSQLVKAGPVTLHADLKPVWKSLIDPVQKLVPFVDIPEPPSTVVDLASFDAHAFAPVLWVAADANTLMVVALCALVLSIVVASRRLVVSMFLGIGLVLVAFLWWFVLLNHQTLLPAVVTADPFTWPIVHRFLVQASADLKGTGIVTGVVGALIAAFSIVAMNVLARVRVQRARAAALPGERVVGDRSIRYDAYSAYDRYDA